MIIRYLLLSLIVFSVTCLNVRAEDNKGCALGVFMEGVPGNVLMLEEFERLAGQKPAQVVWYADWNTPFPSEHVKNLAGRGYLPHITWEPWDWDSREGISFDDILAGKWDSYLAKWAKAARKCKTPVYLRWGHEFNGDWYPWCLGINGVTPHKYAQTFRYIVDYFRKKKARNVKWIWCPDAQREISAGAYPGDDYVDWLGLDVYNFGENGHEGSRWISFDRAIYASYYFLRKHFPSKPIMICEMGSAENGGDKGQWIEKFDRSLRFAFPGIVSFVWFNISKEADWRIDSSGASLEAFRKMMQRPYFKVGPGIIENMTASDLKAREQDAKEIDFGFGINVPGQYLLEKRSFDITIDGNPDEWGSNVPELVLEHAEQVHSGKKEFLGAKDLSGKFKLVWDEQALYICAYVNDERLVGSAKPEIDTIWNGDNIEITLGTDPGAMPMRMQYSQKDWQIGFAPPSKQRTKPAMHIWRGSTQGAENIEYAFTGTETGYGFEVRIPWEFLKTDDVVKLVGNKIRLEIALDDADIDDAGRQSQMVWSGDSDFYMFPSQWGFAKLVEKAADDVGK